MESPLLHTLLVSVCVYGIAQTDAGVCKESPGNKNTFTYILTNSLRPPYFNHTAILVIERDAPFEYYMRRAIEICPQFTGMEAKYYPDIGWFITSLNGVVSTYKEDGSYWSIIDKYGKFSCLGASNFIPQHTSIYTLNFTDISPSF